METNKTEWLEKANNGAKKSRKKMLLALLAGVFGIGLFAGGYYYFNMTDSGADNPPSLQFLGEQGFIGTGMYIQFQDSDITASQSKSFPKTALKGVQAFYSDTDISLKTVIDSIKPDKTLKIMFAYYNDSSRKFDVYPKGPYSDTNLIEGDKLEQYIIPKHRGFFLVASKDYSFSNPVKLYSETPSDYYSTLKDVMNGYKNVGTKVNSAEQTVPDYDWRLMTGTADDFYRACGSRVASLFVSSTPTVNGVDFVRFGTKERVGFATWIKFGGNSGSCQATATPVSSGPMGSCINGTIISNQYACIDSAIVECKVANYGDNKFNLYCDDKGWRTFTSSDIVDEITASTRLLEAMATYRQDVAKFVSDVGKLVTTAEQRVNGLTGMKISDYAKASTLEDRLKAPIQSTVPVSNFESLQNESFQSPQQVLQGKLMSGEIAPITSLSKLGTSQILQDLVNTDKVLLIKLKAYQGKINAELANIDSEISKANGFSTDLKISTSKTQAREKLLAVQQAHDGANGSKVKAEFYFGLSSDTYNQIMTVVASKELTTDVETNEGSSYSDDKYKIDPSLISNSWHEFAICLAKELDYEKCKVHLPFNTGSVYFEKSKIILDVCLFLNNQRKDAEEYSPADTYACVSSYIQIYVNDELKDPAAKVSAIVDDYEAKYLRHVTGDHQTIITCDDRLAGSSFGNFYCDGEAWEEITLNLEDPIIEISNTELSFIIKKVGTSTNFKINKDKIYLKGGNYVLFGNTNRPSSIFEEDNKSSIVFPFEDNANIDASFDFELVLLPGAIYSSKYTNWSNDVLNYKYANTKILLGKDCDNMNVNINQYCYENKWVECNVETANKKLDKHICSLDYTNYIEGVSNRPDLLRWFWLNDSTSEKTIDSNYTLKFVNYYYLAVISESSFDDWQIGPTKAIKEKLSDDNSDETTFLFYCGPGFEGLLSPMETHGCGFNGSTYKIVNIADPRFQPDKAKYGFLSYPDKTTISYYGDDFSPFECFKTSPFNNYCNLSNIATQKLLSCTNMNLGEQVNYFRPTDEGNGLEANRYVCVYDDSKKYYFWMRDYNDDPKGLPEFSKYGVLPIFNSLNDPASFKLLNNNNIWSDYNPNGKAIICNESNNIEKQYRAGEYTYVCTDKNWQSVKHATHASLVSSDNKWLFPYNDVDFFNNQNLSFSNHHFWQKCDSTSLGFTLPVGFKYYTCKQQGDTYIWQIGSI